MSVPLPEPEDLVPAEEDAGFRLGFDATLAEVHDALLAYLRRQLGDDEVAADLTQEALLRMMRYRDAPGIADRRAMLFHIAHNLVLEHRRAEDRHRADHHVPLEEIASLPTEHPPMEAIADARQAINRLLTRTLAELPPKCRLAFLLIRFDGLSYRQVATQLGVSVKMVEKHVARAGAACRLAVGDRDF